MHIVHIASELTPIAKVGGLADVVYGLSKELAKKDNVIEIIIPKYDCLHIESLKDLQADQHQYPSFYDSETCNNTIWSAKLENLNVFLLESHHHKQFFNRKIIYGCEDDIDRFTYFSRAALEYLFKAGKQPDIIHLHDWPTAVVAVLYKDLYRALGYKTKGIVLTIHNMEHQGRCQPFNLSRIGLKVENYLSPDQMQDPRLPDQVNLLKGGIEYADRLTTVSPRYEKEILTPEGGFGLENTIIKHKKKLKGILNGIDEDFWNPEKDPYLVLQYSTQNITKKNIESVIAAKEENKKHLRSRLQLKQTQKPLVAAVTRLVPQKSPDLIKHALMRTLEQGGQFVLLGSTPISLIHKEFERLQEDLQNNDNAAVLMDKDEELAHLIFAAADLLVIPSFFEPCGLTQLIGFKYGTVPVVRLTGGLADTVFDIDTSNRPIGERNGFTFDFPDVKGVNWALDRAIRCFSVDQDKWRTLMMNGMKKDHSWKHVAPDYIQVYREAIANPKID